MNNDGYPGTGAGFLSFFVIGLLVYGLTSSAEFWPRLTELVIGDRPASAATTGTPNEKTPKTTNTAQSARGDGPVRKAATVEWDELLTGHGLNITVPEDTRQESNR